MSQTPSARREEVPQHNQVSTSPDAPGMNSAALDKHAARRRNMIFALCVTFATIGAGAVLVPILKALWNQDPWIMELLEGHFAALVGLPSIALLAFILVVLLEARFDKIEMEFFGVVRFKGASGPIILWGFLFLLMATTLRFLW
ncbi:hypothetical protein ACFYQ5_28405 [Streptomyces sp. NPDC005794]|uniref:hypothetical protein n=1 Tax=Streptomyces sp. NPDC005794 TaxID=3364733 RepID=UPI003697F890